MPNTSLVLASWPQVEPVLEDLYQELHRHPELSFEEYRTADTVAAVLIEQGFEVHRGVGGTGVVGVLENGPGAGVLVRAELDGLSVEERTGLSYASSERTTSGQALMHACGHDLHMAALLGATRLLADHRDQWSGRLVAVLQPAEETGQGAAAMAADRLAQLAGPVDVAFSQHVMTQPVGAVYLRCGPVLSTATTMRIVLHGRSAHASSPQASVDATVLAAMVVLRLQTLISREYPPDEFGVVTVGTLHSGTVANAISERAELELSLRTYSPAGLDRLLSAIERVCIAESTASQAPRPPEFEIGPIFPLTDNDEEVTERLRVALKTNLGHRVCELPRQTASEDFAHVAACVDAPYCYWGLGGLPKECFVSSEGRQQLLPDAPTNHSPIFAPQVRPALEVGAKALVVAALEWLGDSAPS